MIAGLAAVTPSVMPAKRGQVSVDDRPNIVVLQTDDQTADSLRFMPEVRRLLEKQGTTFTRYFASYPLCCPSRATYFSGQYAHNHGVEYNTAPTGGFYAFRHIKTTFPVALRRAGYRTIHIGKYLNGYGRRNPKQVPPGWSDWEGSVDPFTYRYYDFVLNVNGRLRRFGPRAYQTNVYSQLAVEKIRSAARRHQPLFLDVAFLAPHAVDRETSGLDPEDQEAVGKPHTRHGIRYPVPAPRDFGKFVHARLPDRPAFDEAHVSDKPPNIRARPRFTPTEVTDIRRNYRFRLETLAAVDRAVRRIVHVLRATNQLDRTDILFLSDNGFFHGEHRVPYGKYLPYEPSARVPLVVRGPGIASDVRTDALTSNVDLAPTILDLAGTKPLRRQDGHSLLPLLRDPHHAPPADAVLLESGPNVVGAPVYHAVRTARYKLVEYRDGARELYDLKHDPYELTNRAGDRAFRAVERRLHHRLARLRACKGRACRRADS